MNIITSLLKCGLLFLFFVCATEQNLASQGTINTVFKRNNFNPILNKDDVQKYKIIFNLQDYGKISEADDIIESLESNILVPYVLADRFVGPFYRTKRKEFEEWINNYKDYGVADKVVSVAKHKGMKVDDHKVSDNSQFLFMTHDVTLERIDPNLFPSSVRKDVAQFKKFARRFKTKNASDILDKIEGKLSLEQFYQLKSYLAFVYYLDGYLGLAEKLSVEILDNHDTIYSHWVLGLIHYRQQNFTKSLYHFESLEKISKNYSTHYQASIFWQAVVLSRMDMSKRSKTKLKIIADKYPLSFYGMIANSSLKKTPKYIRRNVDKIKKNDMKWMIQFERGVRLLCLLQIGRFQDADLELLKLVELYGTEEFQVLFKFATEFNLPESSKQLAVIIKDDLSKKNELYMLSYTRIPSVDVAVENVDRSLLLAIMRRESRFNVKIKSRSGAMGLMQLLPSTVRFIVNKNDGEGIQHNHQLYLSKINIYIGSLFVDWTLKLSYVDYNLIKFLIAYNAGGGNLKKWEKHVKSDDPLILLESIPSFQTRQYIKYVIANYWMYKTGIKEDFDLENLLMGKHIFVPRNSDER
ncbi:MAG: lytic transglycosylase domain-containing protein [Alphaproteobacteria bacterium]|nr:lytic transglycosylase domain-containing protein [Alphaproteobacteria bacterium]MBL0717765.1 lytic transglycosylase domain-containing protein [Alphaproteobacteria bacterium]